MGVLLNRKSLKVLLIDLVSISINSHSLNKKMVAHSSKILFKLSLNSNYSIIMLYYLYNKNIF